MDELSNSTGKNNNCDVGIPGFISTCFARDLASNLALEKRKIQDFIWTGNEETPSFMRNSDSMKYLLEIATKKDEFGKTKISDEKIKSFSDDQELFFYNKEQFILVTRFLAKIALSAVELESVSIEDKDIQEMIGLFKRKPRSSVLPEFASSPSSSGLQR